KISYSDIPGMELLVGGGFYFAETNTKQILFAGVVDTDSLQDRITPVRVARLCGINRLLMIGTAVSFRESESAFVIVRDHINLLGDNPLIGPNADRFGTRFPDMTDVYPADFAGKIRDELRFLTGKEIIDGVLVAVDDIADMSPSERQAIGEVGQCYLTSELVPESIGAKHTGMEIGAVLVSSDEKDRDISSDDAECLHQLLVRGAGKFF
ncbi:MAG: hypothetical protein K9N53_02070, partial [Candidatus Marinimicrobia bacterium]|nr:hypothetical protein [Candidatus Neomarinimicrobiota bacterium]